MIEKNVNYDRAVKIQVAQGREHYLKTSQGMRLLKRRLKEYFHSRKTA